MQAGCDYATALNIEVDPQRRASPRMGRRGRGREQARESGVGVTSLPPDVLLQIFLGLPTSGTCYILGQLLLYSWTSRLGVGMKKDKLPLFLSCRGAGERGGVPELEGLWLL